MAKQIADVQIHASDENDLEDDNLDISVDLIDDGLYLGKFCLILHFLYRISCMLSIFLFIVFLLKSNVNKYIIYTYILTIK